MPKVKYCVPEKKAPEIDILKAVTMERRAVLGLSFEDLAVKTGLSERHLRTLFQESPWDWTREQRKMICENILQIPREIPGLVFMY